MNNRKAPTGVLYDQRKVQGMRGGGDGGSMSSKAEERSIFENPPFFEKESRRLAKWSTGKGVKRSKLGDFSSFALLPGIGWQEWVEFPPAADKIVEGTLYQKEGRPGQSSGKMKNQLVRG